MSLRFGFEIKMEKGPVPRPHSLHFAPLAGKEPPKPFKYMADALCGLSLVKIHPDRDKIPGLPASFCESAWHQLEPHWEIWQRSRNRAKALHAESPKADRRSGAEFAEFCRDVLRESCSRDGVDLRGLWKLVDPINALEERKKSALMYNFGLSFSDAFCEQLCALHSFLFHLRSLVAIDWNGHIDDPSHEAVQVDSITDYLPKADYIVNDALLYWKFMNLSRPFTEGRQADVHVEKLLVDPMLEAFRQSSHNACQLVDHVPSKLFQELSPSELEEALYLIQMDWLLASEAGLLFRIREELYGLQNGYDRIFWPDVHDSKPKKPFHLSVAFSLSQHDLKQGAA